MKAERFYSSLEVSQLTGVTLRKLQWWDEQGWACPSVNSRCGSGCFRGYTAEDIRLVQIVARLRDCHVKPHPKCLRRWLSKKWLLFDTRGYLLMTATATDPGLIMSVASASRAPVVLVELP